MVEYINCMYSEPWSMMEVSPYTSYAYVLYIIRVCMWPVVDTYYIYKVCASK